MSFITNSEEKIIKNYIKDKTKKNPSKLIYDFEGNIIGFLSNNKVIDYELDKEEITKILKDEE